MRKYANFDQKVFWITGASSGIGRALSNTLSEQGAKLILSSRNTDKLEEVNQSLPRNPGTARVLQLDLGQPETIVSKVSEAMDLFGRIDYFISNAGVAVRDLASQTQLEIDRRLMEVNYFGSIAMTKALLAHFERQKNGHIVVISSLSGRYGVPKLAAYSASKHALHGFYESLRSETHRSDLKITLVIPGIINTEITAHALTGSGDIHGKIERSFENAYPADKASEKILRAVYREKEEVFIGGSEGITLKLNRISPWLLRRFIRNHPLKRLRKLRSRFGLK